MKKHSCAVGSDEYTVHKWAAEDINFLTYYEISIRAQTRTHTHTHTHTHPNTHTQQLKTEWHSAAYISSYRPQHHSQAPQSVAYDMFIIKGKYCEWCNNSPPLHFSQQFTKNVNSSYGNCCTDREEPCAWLPCSPYLTPLDFYLCGYKGVGVTGSQAWVELILHTMDDAALKLNSHESK